MATAISSWTQLRQQARSLEAETENFFQSYAAYTTSDLTVKPSDQEVSLEREIHDILERRDTVVASLSRTLDSESPVNASAAKLQNLLRHKEILADHRKEFQRIKNNLHSARERANLLSSVRNDIDRFHHSAAREDSEYLLDERRRLDNSHNVADSVLSQAYAINENFAQQRAMLGNINRRVMYAASQIPGINTIISKINTRKKRDSIILGTLIALCLLMVLYFR